MNYCTAVFRLLILFCCLSAAIPAQNDDQVIITGIEDGKMVYKKYSYGGQFVIDISDMIISDGVHGARDVFNTYYDDPQYLRVLLLRKGYAKLNESNKASPPEIDAQNHARSAGIGIWKQPTPDPTSPSAGINWSSVWKFIWQGFLILGSIGVVGALGKSFYRKFYIQRTIRLLMIGEPSSGKTALLMSLVDPHVPKSVLLKTEVSKAITQKRGLTHIPRGKFEIVPEITDVPGSAFASVWDKLIGHYNHALLIVLCPHKTNGLAQDGSSQLLDISTGIDQKYIDIQIGYVQAYVEGGLGAKRTRKPKMVIMFVSKFDLFCTTPPDDSASQEVRQKVLTVFRDHINSGELAAKKAKIPFELILGSAVEKWNTEQILTVVARALYKS